MIRPFGDFLRDQRAGEMQEELAVELNRLVAAVTATGKKGKLVLTLTVAPLREATEQLVVEDDIVAKLPKMSKGATLYYGTPENNLSRRDPRQADLEFKSVPVREAPELKSVARDNAHFDEFGEHKQPPAGVA